jgi:hypothetical protein
MRLLRILLFACVLLPVLYVFHSAPPAAQTPVQFRAAAPRPPAHVRLLGEPALQDKALPAPKECSVPLLPVAGVETRDQIAAVQTARKNFLPIVPAPPCDSKVR